MSDDAQMVRIRDLRFHRGDRMIFDGVTMDIPRGKITAIMGPSGTGKTTLLKLIAAQIKPTSGEVLVNGQALSKLSRQALYEARKKIGMLFQSGALLTDLSVFDNVAFPLRRHTQLPERLIRHLVLMRLQMVGLRNARDLMPNELSGGMARRVALARALVFDPPMIMYDEPFTGQDPISMGVLIKLIKTMNDALGITGIVVSHDVEETLSIADQVYVISEGKVMAEGSPAELMQSEMPWVKQFIKKEDAGAVPFHYPGCSLHEDLGMQEKTRP